MDSPLRLQKRMIEHHESRSQAVRLWSCVAVSVLGSLAGLCDSTAGQLPNGKSGFTENGSWRPTIRTSARPMLLVNAEIQGTGEPRVTDESKDPIETPGHRLGPVATRSHETSSSSDSPAESAVTNAHLAAEPSEKPESFTAAPADMVHENTKQSDDLNANEAESGLYRQLDVEAVLQGNPLLHQGPYLETPVGTLPIESLSSPLSGGAANIDSYDDFRGIEILESADFGRSMSLQIGGRSQVRYTWFRDRSDFRNQAANQFDLARTRLGFRGYVFEKYLRYNIAVDLSPARARLANGFAEIDLQDSLGIGFGNSTRLRYGYWRTNFGRQAAESSQNMQFVDRSLTSTVFNLGTNTGIALLGEFTHFYRPVNYELALTNGFGTFGSSSRDELDTNPGVAMRITEEIFGDYSSGESDNELNRFAAVRIGASAAFTKRTRRGVDGSTVEFDNSPAMLLVSDPANGKAVFSMDQLNGVEQSYDMWLGGVELDCKHAGWSFHTEYLMRWIDNVQFNSNDAFQDFTHGYYVQGGYFLTEKVEVVVRHSTIYANGSGSGSPIAQDYQTKSNESGGGVNFYFRRHFSKLQLDLFHYDGVPIDSSALNLVAGDRGMMLRLQYQLAF